MGQRCLTCWGLQGAKRQAVSKSGNVIGVTWPQSGYASKSTDLGDSQLQALTRRQTCQLLSKTLQNGPGCLCQTRETEVQSGVETTQPSQARTFMCSVFTENLPGGGGGGWGTSVEAHSHLWA